MDSFGWRETIFICFLFAGHFKADERLEWLPVDLTLLTFGLSIIAIFSNLLFRPQISRSVGWIVLLYASFLPSLLMSGWSEYTTEKTLRFYTLTLLASLAPFFLIQDSKQLRRFFAANMLIATVMALQAGVNLVRGAGQIQRLEAFGSNTIALGRTVGMLFICLILLTVNKRIPTLPGIVAAIISAVILMASGSRGPMLSAILALIFTFTLLGFSNRKNHFLLLFMGLALVVVLQFGASWLPTGSIQRVVNFTSGQYGTSENLRYDAYAASWESIRLHPAGLGLGGFEQVDSAVGQELNYPHNILAEAFVEGGLGAGMILCGLLILGFLRCYRACRAFPQKTEFRLLFALASFGLMTSMTSGDFNDNKYTFALLSMLFVSSHLTLQGSTARERSQRAKQNGRTVGSK